MSTQGILSLMRYGSVACKIVTGCNGFCIPRLVEVLKCKPTTDVGDLLEFCKQCHVGCDRCRVIQTSATGFVPPDVVDSFTKEDLDRWRRTFNDPGFNPRWEIGTAQYSYTVDV